MDFGNKDADDNTWSFNTGTARVDHQTKNFRQFVSHNILGAACIPIPGRCWNVVAYFSFA